MRQTMLVVAMGLVAGAVQAQDVEAGATLAADCSVCHGVAGVSVEEAIPNLAAQKAEYLAAQLEAFRSGDRENELMNAIAAQLSDDDIANLAAHFAGLPGAEPGAVGESGGVLSDAKLAFPADYKESFQRYHTISFDDREQVRHYWVDEASLDALSKGEDLPDGAYVLVEVFKARTDDAGAPVRGDDGHFAEGDIAVFTAMQKSAGWGDEVPAILRNGDWRYAVFDAAGEVRAGTNEGRCLACHKPLDDTDFLFLHDELKAFAASR
jgi:cytochrome c553